MNGHTPTPWKMLPSKDLSGDVGITADNLPNVLAECFADIRQAGERSTVEAQANAAFIVRAVNAHDELVAALERILRYAVPHPDDTAEDRVRDMLHIEHYARAALAKAEATP